MMHAYRTEGSYRSAARMTAAELRAAIEELGGEAPEREFYDDPEYEALHPMDDGDDDTPMQ